MSQVHLQQITEYMVEDRPVYVMTTKQISQSTDPIYLHTVIPETTALILIVQYEPKCAQIVNKYGESQHTYTF